jgi:hypothetical protein
MLGTLFALAWAVATGFVLGRLFELRKQRKEISLLRDSLDFWRRRYYWSYSVPSSIWDKAYKDGEPSFRGDVWDGYK